MMYLWKGPEDYANKYIAVYNEEISVDRFILGNGHALDLGQTKGQFILELGVTEKAVTSKFDCIPSTSGVPLVNEKIISILQQLAPEEVQFIDAEVHCKDGVLTNYKLLNVTKTFVGIDHEKSICKTMPSMPDDPDSPHFIYGFNYLVYKPGCLGTLKLAIDEERKSNLLVTEEVKQAFEKAKIKGVRFVIPEEHYANMYR